HRPYCVNPLTAQHRAGPVRDSAPTATGPSPALRYPAYHPYPRRHPGWAPARGRVIAIPNHRGHAQVDNGTGAQLVDRAGIIALGKCRHVDIQPGRPCAGEQVARPDHAEDRPRDMDIPTDIHTPRAAITATRRATAGHQRIIAQPAMGAVVVGVLAELAGTQPVRRVGTYLQRRMALHRRATGASIVQ